MGSWKQSIDNQQWNDYIIKNNIFTSNCYPHSWLYAFFEAIVWTAFLCFSFTVPIKNALVCIRSTDSRRRFKLGGTRSWSRSFFTRKKRHAHNKQKFSKNLTWRRALNFLPGRHLGKPNSDTKTAHRDIQWEVDIDERQPWTLGKTDHRLRVISIKITPEKQGVIHDLYYTVAFSSW